MGRKKSVRGRRELAALRESIGCRVSEYTVLVSQDIVIQQDDEIRLKIVGTRVDKNDIVSLLPASLTVPGCSFLTIQSSGMFCAPLLLGGGDGWAEGLGLGLRG